MDEEQNRSQRPLLTGLIPKPGDSDSVRRSKGLFFSALCRLDEVQKYKGARKKPGQQEAAQTEAPTVEQSKLFVAEDQSPMLLKEVYWYQVRRPLAVWLTFAFVMLLFPPWTYVYKGPPLELLVYPNHWRANAPVVHVERQAGYSFIFDSQGLLAEGRAVARLGIPWGYDESTKKSRPPLSVMSYVNLAIDTKMLVLELVGSLILAFLWVVFRKRPA